MLTQGWAWHLNVWISVTALPGCSHWNVFFCVAALQWHYNIRQVALCITSTKDDWTSWTLSPCTLYRYTPLPPSHSMMKSKRTDTSLTISRTTPKEGRQLWKAILDIRYVMCYKGRDFVFVFVVIYLQDWQGTRNTFSINTYNTQEQWTLVAEAKWVDQINWSSW